MPKETHSRATIFIYSYSMSYLYQFCLKFENYLAVSLYTQPKSLDSDSFDSEGGARFSASQVGPGLSCCVVPKRVLGLLET